MAGMNNITDAALNTLTAARLTRFVTTDEMGEWWIKDPVDRAMGRYVDRVHEEYDRTGEPFGEPWWWKYRSGLDCKWCVGFWLASATTAATTLVRGTRAEGVWRFVRVCFATNYAAALVQNLEAPNDDDEDEVSV